MPSLLVKYSGENISLSRQCVYASTDDHSAFASIPEFILMLVYLCYIWIVYNIYIFRGLNLLRVRLWRFTIKYKHNSEKTCKCLINCTFLLFQTIDASYHSNPNFQTSAVIALASVLLVLGVFIGALLVWK